MVCRETATGTVGDVNDWRTALRVATWNVLAERYALAERYGYTENGTFDERGRRVLDTVLGVIERHDVVVLQEVEEWLVSALDPYVVGWAPHPGSPVGVATLSRHGAITTRVDVIGGRATLVSAFDLGGVVVEVIGAHLRWSGDAGVMREQAAGLAQLVHGGPGVLAADANAAWSSAALEPLRRAGWTSDTDRDSAYVDGRWRALDVIAVLGGEARSSVEAGDVVIPSPRWPSDHRVVSATATFR